MSLNRPTRFFVRPLLFCSGGTRPPVEDLKAFIDEHRDQYGVEPICRVLPIAPSAYSAHAAKKANPDLRSDRAKRYDRLSVEIRRVFDENYRVYLIRKVWRKMKREGFDISQCIVERLMKAMTLKVVIRGKRIRTKIPDDHAYRPLDLVKRQFKAERPNALWVAVFTYVSTW